MDSQKMELRKLRDFSQNLNDTFQFIKQELKPLLGSFMAICGVFIILSGIVGGIYQQDSVKDILKAFTGVKIKERGISDVFSGMYFLLLFVQFFSYILMAVVLAVYFKLYETKGKVSPTIEEVWNKTMQYIMPLFFFSIVYIILTVISVFFCIVPFFYFAVVFAPFTIIYVMEDCSFGVGFNRCFALIKENYWMSFAIYFVAYIIYAFGAGIIGAIVSIVAGLASYLTTKDVSATVAIVSGILQIFTHVFYIIFFVSVALNYFNLSEQLDGSGLLKRIDNIGATDANEVEEQY
jgi:MFS family permease